MQTIRRAQNSVYSTQNGYSLQQSQTEYDTSGNGFNEYGADGGEQLAFSIRLMVTRTVKAQLIGERVLDRLRVETDSFVSIAPGPEEGIVSLGAHRKPELLQMVAEVLRVTKIVADRLGSRLELGVLVDADMDVSGFQELHNDYQQKGALIKLQRLWDATHHMMWIGGSCEILGEILQKIIAILNVDPQAEDLLMFEQAASSMGDPITMEVFIKDMLPSECFERIESKAGVQIRYVTEAGLTRLCIRGMPLRVYTAHLMYLQEAAESSNLFGRRHQETSIKEGGILQSPFEESFHGGILSTPQTRNPLKRRHVDFHREYEPAAQVEYDPQPRAHQDFPRARMPQEFSRAHTGADHQRSLSSSLLKKAKAKLGEGILPIPQDAGRRTSGPSNGLLPTPSF